MKAYEQAGDVIPQHIVLRQAKAGRHHLGQTHTCIAQITHPSSASLPSSFLTALPAAFPSHTTSPSRLGLLCPVRWAVTPSALARSQASSSSVFLIAYPCTSPLFLLGPGPCPVKCAVTPSFLARSQASSSSRCSPWSTFVALLAAGGGPAGGAYPACAHSALGW